MERQKRENRRGSGERDWELGKSKVKSQISLEARLPELKSNFINHVTLGK